MKKKILVLGHTGSLGSQIYNDLRKEKVITYGLSRSNCNFNDNFQSLKKKIIKIKPDIIINCIAVLGIKFCEEKKRYAKRINFFLPKFLGEITQEINNKLYHFSTEAVFSGRGKKNYYETVKPNANTVYGKTKYLADKFLIKKKNCFIIRLPILYGPSNSNQIITKLTRGLLSNKKVFVSNDIFSSPVYTPFISSFIINQIIKKEYSIKLIHITTNKIVSLYNFMKKISILLKKETYLVKVQDSFFKEKIKKPKNLGLKTKYKFSIDRTTINKKIIKKII